MEPITPAQARKEADNREFPDFVIEAFNECIKEAAIRGTSTVMQEDVVMRMMSLNPELQREDIFAKLYLNVEKYYERAGWKVRYFKPPYWQDWKAYWEFNQ